MPIPETQLVTWSKQGSVAQSSATYTTIKNALEASGSAYEARAYEVFLQGSYGNDTNVFADSDVDVVIRLDSTFQHDISKISEIEKVAFDKEYSNATYGYADFKKGVLAQLKSKFGDAIVKPGKKAILVAASGARRSADVLAAMQYRRYIAFANRSTQRYVEGIQFIASDGTTIINYPKQHSENCTSKHKATSQWFKPTVRVLKNMRNRMIEESLIADGLAPSYFLEGMLYNVPNNCFGNSFSQTFVESIKWLQGTDRSKLLCANEEYYLLHDTSPVTWRAAQCSAFLDAVVDLWNGWS
jgi:hypothetical protein